MTHRPTPPGVPPIKVQRYAVDFQDLRTPVDDRIEALAGNPAGCHYFNPAATISCHQPTAAFFAVVKREQARWCRQASRTFSNRARRGVKGWTSDRPLRTKEDRVLDRGKCFTGLLFIDGRLVPHHEWPVFPESKVSQAAASS